MSKILSDEDGDTIWNEHFGGANFFPGKIAQVAIYNAKLDTGTPTNSKQDAGKKLAQEIDDVHLNPINQPTQRRARQ